MPGSQGALPIDIWFNRPFSARHVLTTVESMESLKGAIAEALGIKTPGIEILTKFFYRSLGSPKTPILPQSGLYTDIPRQDVGKIVHGSIAPPVVAAAAPPEVSTLKTSPEPPAVSDLLGTGIPVPGSNDYIWYAEPVQSASWRSDEYQSHFRFVVGELQKAVDAHKTLCDNADRLVYEARMVGRSQSTAAPAIVVKCPREDVKPLRNLFATCAQYRLNCTVASEWRRRRRRRRKASSPPFRLVFFPRDTPVITRKAKTAGDNIEEREKSKRKAPSTPFQTVFLPRDTPGIARIAKPASNGIRERENSKRKALSPPFRPIFFPRDTPGIARKAKTDGETIDQLGKRKTLCGSLVRCGHRVATAGLLLEIDGAQRLLTVDHLFRNGNLHVEVSVNDLGSFRGQRLRPDTPVMPSSPYLDWALIELDTLVPAPGIMGAQNWIVPHAFASPVRIRGIAPHPPRQSAKVLFVSASHGVQEGVLLAGISYITSGRGRAVCPTLSLVPTSPNGKRYGSLTLFPGGKVWVLTMFIQAAF
jgi:hypothetical protein